MFYSNATRIGIRGSVMDEVKEPHMKVRTNTTVWRKTKQAP